MTPAPEIIAVIGTGIALAAVVLQQMRSLGARFDRLESGQQGLARDLAALSERTGRLESGQQALLERVTGLESGQQGLARDLAALSERTGRLESGQQALLERVTVLNSRGWRATWPRWASAQGAESGQQALERVTGLESGAGVGARPVGAERAHRPHRRRRPWRPEEAEKADERPIGT